MIRSDGVLTQKKGYKKPFRKYGVPKYTPRYKDSNLLKIKKLETKLNKLVKTVKKNEPPLKRKYYEATQNPENSWTGLAPPYPYVGPAENQRIGEIIQIKEITVNFCISVSTSDSFDTFRMAWVQYKDENASNNLPTGGQELLWMNYDGDFPTQSIWNPITKDRYKVLFDKTYNVNKDGLAQISDSFTINYTQLYDQGKLIFIDDENIEFAPALQGGYITGFICSDSAASPNPKIEYSVLMTYTDS